MKEWYLVDNYRPIATSGYESDAISEFAESNFADVLETMFSDVVTLYDSSLSDSKVVRCIVQGNSPDTQLKSLERTVLFPIGTVNTGMYVYFDNAFWLVVSYPSNNKCYEKVTVQMCQYKLRWQNPEGKIIERWVYSEDFTKYSSGVSSGNVVSIGDNQYGLTLPIDNETKQLKRDMRFAIDFDDAAIPEVYKLTNRKVMLNNNGSFGRGGTMIVTMSLNEFNKATDKRVLISDGVEVWICDYTYPTENDNTPTDPKTSVVGEIKGAKTIKIGISRTYTASLTHENGQPLEWSDQFKWNIISDFDIDSIINGNKITLCVEDDSLVDEKFKLEILQESEVVCDTVITVIGAF